MNTFAKGTACSLALLFLALSGCATLHTAPALSTRVEALVAPLVAANEFSGAIVMTRRGQVVYEGGFGMANHAAALAFDIDTPADGGSIAKTFTAASLWWLASEGRVDLDALATRYLPEYPHAQTTVRQLFGHSNGLPAYYEFFDPFFKPNEIKTTAALLRVVAAQAARPSFPPGTQFEYSNLGFDAAALIIERVTGQTYEQFLKARFFDRLGMRSTFARPAWFADWKGVRTLGYRWVKGAWKLWDVFDGEAFLGASNLYFSAADLSRWASANAAGSALPQAVFAAGQRHARIGNHAAPITGLSWYCDKSGLRCHYTGTLNAFHSLVYWDRARDESVAFITNSAVPAWKVIALQRDLVRVLAGQLPEAKPAAILVPFDKNRKANFTGAFHSSELGRVTLSLPAAGDGLRFQIGAGLIFDVFPVAKNVLYLPGLDFWLAFQGGDNPTTLLIRSMYLDLALLRAPH